MKKKCINCDKFFEDLGKRSKRTCSRKCLQEHRHKTLNVAVNVLNDPMNNVLQNRLYSKKHRKKVVPEKVRKAEDDVEEYKKKRNSLSEIYNKLEPEEMLKIVGYYD